MISKGYDGLDEKEKAASVLARAASVLSNENPRASYSANSMIP